MSDTDILDSLKKEIASLSLGAQKSNVGTISEVSDGIATVSGLSELSYGEIVSLPHGLTGLALNLQDYQVGIIIFGDYKLLKEGDEARATGRTLEVPVGEAMLGRVVDSLGNPLDGKGPIKARDQYPVEKIAPGVISRESVDTALQTGIKSIDAMIPIGRGQRELIIGDRGLGKTALTIDAIINQKGKGVLCIYVAIGQKTSKIAQVVAILEKNGAMDHTVVVAAPASDSASMQYIAPYSGTALGEYFVDSGKDALVVYDDLSKHAWAYRQISLLLRRPSGREAYPGDVFYLHSRLLERSAKLNKANGGGSLTALPIIETQAGDVSAYIPTNVISITDGQIFLESDLFYSGIRPAVNVGVSVSRVGGSAQIAAMRKVAGTLRLDLSQFRELAAFAQFGSDLDPETSSRLERGKRVVEVLKQPQFSPLSVESQIAIIFAVTKGFLDKVPVEDIKDYETKYLDFLTTRHQKLLDSILKENKLTDELSSQLEKITAEFTDHFLEGKSAK